MKPGDIVRRNEIAWHASPRVHGDLGGIIIDKLEGEDGFFNYRVFFIDCCEWFSDLELEVISESR